MARAVNDVPATPHFDFLYGSFVLSKWHIPYLSTTMSLADAADCLRLATELPGAEDIAWRIDELYQRDIDWPRVGRQIVPYLNNREVPQFFNSITIALLPYDSNTTELLPAFADSQIWNPPTFKEASRFAKQVEIGPLRLGYWDSWDSSQDAGFNSGQLRWNPDEVFAVAIDGQHRLAALKTLVADGSIGKSFKDSRVPVILLVFDERLGYLAPEHRPTVELLRALFIDLNKHAQTVSRARQILLDDRDPHAACVRQLVATQLSDNVNELSHTPPRLPLALVDWYSEQAKFDDGPCISTVLGLDWIVSRALSTKPIQDFTDYGAVKRQLRSLETQLGISLSAAINRTAELENVQLSPFVYKEEELAAIADAFGDVWSGALVGLLTGFSPYASLLSRRVDDDSLSLDFQNWYRLLRRRNEDRFAGRATDEYKQFLGRLSTRPDGAIGENQLLERLGLLEDLKHSNGLAFNVVFQRALIEALLEYVRIDDNAVNELAGDDSGAELLPEFDSDLDDYDEEETFLSDEPRLVDPGPSPDEDDNNELKLRVRARSQEFVNHMNRLLEAFPTLLDVNATFETADASVGYFWQGTLRKPEGGIDFTQGASSRAKDLLFLAAAMFLYCDQSNPGIGSDFEEFWAESTNGDGPSLCRRIGRAVRRFTYPETSAAGRILKARDEEYDTDYSVDECYYRLSHLWNAAEL
jgi:hypothetical protein